MALPAKLRVVSVDRKPFCDKEFPADAPQGGFCFYIHEDTLERVRTHGPMWKYDALHLISPAIEKPVAIFKGLKRVDMDDGLCYTSNPTVIPRHEGDDLPVPMDYVFLVFVTPGRNVFDWELRVGSPGKPGHPINSDTDFEECIWPQQ